MQTPSTKSVNQCQSILDDKVNDTLQLQLYVKISLFYHSAVLQAGSLNGKHSKSQQGTTQ